MNTYIKKLQSKSEDARKQILVASLITSMSLVAIVWFYSLGDRFNNKKEEVAQVSPEVKPFTLFAKSIGDTYNNIAASVGNVFSSDKMNTTATEKQIDLIPVEPKDNQ